MDKFMNGTAGFGTSSGLGQPGASELEANTLTQSSDTTGIEAKQTELRESFKVNDGTRSGLVDKTSRISSQERLMTQMRLVGRSSVVLMASLNIALFTPIEYSFGKMTSMSFNAMLFCLNKYDEEKEKTKRLKNSKRQKRHGLKRATNFARKAGALIGFGAMAVLMGGFGSVAAGSAFSIYNSLRVQDGSDS